MQKICGGCGEVKDWAPDQRHLLGVKEHEVFEIDLETKVRRTVASAPDYEPMEAAYSPDGKWAAITAGVRGRGLVGAILPAGQLSAADRPAVRWLPFGELRHREQESHGMECGLRAMPRAGQRTRRAPGQA